MSDDNRTFIEQSQSFAEKVTGKPATVHDMAREFAGYDIQRRAQILDQMDAESADDDDISFGSKAFKKMMQTHKHRRVLGDVHAALRRKGR